MKFSFASLARQALTGHQGWTPQWRSPDLKPAYDIVIVGGGGHGLATAYYLAKEHGVANVAVLERGWLGGGNTGRNTTIVRSTICGRRRKRSTATPISCGRPSPRRSTTT